MPETIEDRRDVIIGKLQYTSNNEFAADPMEDRGMEHHDLYVVTDGETARLNTAPTDAGRSLADFVGDSPDPTDHVYGADERTLDDLDGSAVEQLDYELDALPADEYNTVLAEAGLDIS